MKKNFIFGCFMCLMASVGFTSCSDDDKGGNFNDVIVGTWEQDGDDDILQINSGGTGLWYNSLDSFLDNESRYNVSWSYNGEIFEMSLSYYYEGSMHNSQFWKGRIESYSQDKFVYKVYETEGGKVEDNHWWGDDILHDANGYYYLWTFIRLK